MLGIVRSFWPIWLTPVLSLALVAASGAWALTRTQSAVWAPLDYHNLQPVDLAASDLQPGGAVVVTGTKCNRSAEDVAVTTNTFWRESATRVLTVRTVSNVGVLPPGCITTTFRNLIPMTLPPGTYQILGFETGHQGTHEQLEPWYTEPFPVRVR